VFTTVDLVHVWAMLLEQKRMF